MKLGLANKIFGPSIAILTFLTLSIGYTGFEFARESELIKANSEISHRLNAMLAELQQLLNERQVHVHLLVQERDLIRNERVITISRKISKLLDGFLDLKPGPAAGKYVRRLIKGERDLSKARKELSSSIVSSREAEILRGYTFWRIRQEKLLADFQDMNIYNIRWIEGLVRSSEGRRLQSFRLILWLFFAGFCLLLMSAASVSKGVIRPIRQMTLAARRISSGDLETRVALSTREDELESLARAFNSMTEHLIAANTQLREAIQSRDQFISVASHELRTPLTALGLQLGIMGREMSAIQKDGSSSRTARAMTVANRQLHRLNQLIDDLLDVSRIQHGKLILRRSSTDLVLLCQELIERFQDQLAAEKVEIRLQAPEALIGWWDASRLEQVLVNLLFNVFKYAPGSPVDLRLFCTGDDAILVFQDYGPGIKAEDQRRVFDQFERSVKDFGVSGLGLGLFIVREIVEIHGGGVRLLQEENAGAVFEIRLPLKGEVEPPIKEDAPQAT